MSSRCCHSFTASSTMQEKSELGRLRFNILKLGRKRPHREASKNEGCSTFMFWLEE